jgi:type IV secretion system protein VirB10
MYILGGVVAVFMLIMMLVASDRARKQSEDKVAAPVEKGGGNTAAFAKEIAGNKTNGLIAPAPPKIPDMPGGPAVPVAPSANPAAPIAIARPANPDMPPVPPARPDMPNQPMSAPVDAEAQHIRQAKEQMFEAAVKASTRVSVGAARSSGSALGGAGADQGPPRTREEVMARIAQVQQEMSAKRSTDPTAAYQEQVAQLRNLGIGGAAQGGGGGAGGAAPQLFQAASTGARNSYSQFGPNGQNDRWKLDSQVEAPRSPYELRAGFVVPATLISGINSELPGQIVAQVSQDVYDTPTGKWKLIPQGSRLVGQYSSEVGYGQSRVLVAWQRIVFPDGKALDIGAMPGADGAGYAGFNDKVNNHYMRIFGSALLMSAITAGATVSQNCAQNSSNASGGLSTNCELSQALGQQLGTTTAQLIQKNLSIAPTLEIRPGYRFNVIVTKDMTFTKPYRQFDY